MQNLENDSGFMSLVNCRAPSGEDPLFRCMEGALTLYHEYGESILAISGMRQLLDRYDAAIEITQETMRQAGVADICGLCAEKTGSCCFQEVETWYDPMLLLINLLLKAELPRSRQIPGQCIFLGKKGCRLRARYAFCLNYFCPPLKIQLGAGAVNITLAAVGQELAAGWELEQSLYRWFKGQS
jgi:hypothetical protein